MRFLVARLICASLTAALRHGESINLLTEVFGADFLRDCEFLSPDHTSLATVCTLQSDGTLSVAGKPMGYLQTKRSYKNYRLSLDWRWTGKTGNSGVLLHIATGPLDRNLWPRCLQVQLKHAQAGDLLPMAGARFNEPLPNRPAGSSAQLSHFAADSERRVGAWNHCEIVCDGGHVEVSVNSVKQNRVTGCEPSEGHIGLQLEGAPYEIRKAQIEEL
ncbi:MAG: DUF1080 domain-containing protein [Opitutus sp.]